jgi:RNA polymerase sigma factor (sigma-70 family)
MRNRRKKDAVMDAQGVGNERCHPADGEQARGKGEGPVPTTSTTMLKQIAGAAEHPRWEEFVAKYRPMLEAFARGRFPELEADDLIQETLLGVMKALPEYVAREDKKGAFHNFLTGVLRHKALDALRREGRRTAAEAKRAPGGTEEGGSRGEEWMKTIYAVALEQLMGNPKLGARTKQIFKRTALDGEKPQAVADSLLVSRDVVDQTKRRMMERLRETVERLKHVDGI